MKNLFFLMKSLAFSLTITLTLMMLLSAVGSAMAQENRLAPAGSVPTLLSQGPADPAELESFLDDLLGKQMEEYHIAGAAVSIVKDGKLFFAKGYGYADLKNKIPVDPEETIFRIGSATKPFTWTAVMQLVEQGKLDLDADINAYLDFRIPNTYPQPITLRHLLTHTPGFEDLHVDFVTLKGEDLVPVREWLISHMPERVFPPGDYAAYSNYGAALAGYIVARVSGQSYEEYVQEHILDPLGMEHSTAHWPLPPDLRARESVGYLYADGAFQVFPDLIGQPAIWPAGGMRVSVTDMARFMIAQLQGGRYSDAIIPERRILTESTVQQMHTTLYTPDPRLLGTAYGLFDFSDNGQWTIGHSGTAEPMRSLLLLLPDQNLGVFVVYNSDGGRNLINQHLGFQRAFFDHYYAAPAIEPIQPPADFAERAGRFEGTFRITAIGSYTTLEKIKVLMGSTVAIRASGDGALLFATPWGQWRFVEVEPLYFRQVDGQFALLFRENDRGHISHMFTNVTPMYAYEKLNWYGTPGFNVRLLLVCILVFLSVLSVALIRAIRNRFTKDNQKSAPRGARVANGILLAICILNLLFVVGNFLWGQRIDFGISLIYKIVLGLGVLSAVLNAGALVYTVLAWKSNYWGIAARLYYTLVTVAGAAFIWFLNYWNLLGWRY